MPRYLWSIVGLAAGVFLGMALASAVMPRDRERVASLEHDLQAASKQASDDLSRIDQLEDDLEAAKKKATEETAKRATAEAGAEKSAKDLRESEITCRQMTLELLKSQAFIGMIRKTPEIRHVLLGDNFARQYKSSWFFPDTAYKMVGGKWLGDDLKEQGLLEATIDATVPSDTSDWRQLGKWRVTGSRTTPSFVTSAGLWKVAWTQHKSPHARVYIGVFDAKNQQVATAAGSGEDSSFVHVAPGEYYLDISVTSIEATVSAMEPE